MSRKQAERIVWLLITGILLAAGTGTAYRALMAEWRGDALEPLITAAFAGVTYFTLCLLGLRWAERRQELERRDR